MAWRRVVRLAALLWAGQAWGDEPLLPAAPALAADDECHSDGPPSGECAVSALQLRAGPQRQAAEVAGHVAPAGVQAEALRVEVAGRPLNVTVFRLAALEAAAATSDGAGGGKAGCGCCCNNGEEKISDFWGTCLSESNSCCKSCMIWTAVQSPFMHSYAGMNAVIVGVMVVPTTPLSGVEGITGSNAASYDYLWSVAASHTRSSTSMALICNPYMSRTQHQLHIHFKSLSSKGTSVRQQLEKATGCRAGSWQDAGVHLGGCKSSQVQLFSAMPGVFSEAYSLMRGGQMGAMKTNPQGAATLGNAGITVFHICGGMPAVLVTSSGGGYCSIEHEISVTPTAPAWPR